MLLDREYLEEGVCDDSQHERKCEYDSLQQATKKLIFISIQIIVTVIASISEKSYMIAYFGVGVQAMSNMADSYEYLKGYCKFDTCFNLLILIGSLCSISLVLVYFITQNTIMQNFFVLWFTGLLVSIPIIYRGIVVYISLMSEKY